MADTDKLPEEIRPRLKLSAGTELVFCRMQNGATSVDPSHGGPMTHAEYEEYLKLTIPALKDAPAAGSWEKVNAKAL